jgi:hypothetical protein
MTETTNLTQEVRGVDEFAGGSGVDQLNLMTVQDVSINAERHVRLSNVPVRSATAR